MLRPLVIEEMVRAGQMRFSEAAVIMPVVIDDVVEYHDALADKAASLKKTIGEISVRPPYPLTWLEARTGSDSYIAAAIHSGEKKAVFAAAVASFEKQGFSIVQGRGASLRNTLPRELDTRNFGGPNAILMTFFCWEVGKKPYSVGGRISPCDEEWRGTFEMGHTLRFRPDDHWVLDAAQFFLIGLAMFHVKNAEVVPFGNRDQRKQNLKGPLGIVVRELVIAPLRRTLDAIREFRSSEPGQPLPLHLRRGHFKTFTAERPLLGKHVGTYWWDPAWRGSEHMGIVVHNRARMVMAE